MAEGEFALVRENIEAALEKPSQGWAPVGDHELYYLLADAAAQLRDLPALLQFAPPAEASARRYGHALFLASAYRAQGIADLLANQHAAAELRLTRALEMFVQLKTNYQIGRTLRELGEVALVQRDRSKARDRFIQACAAFESMKATPDLLRTRAALENLKS